jgi:hypothetical protein
MAKCPPLFCEAMRRHPEAVSELAPETFRRYASGELPKAVDWLLRHPDMLRTLVELLEREAARRDSQSLTKT